MHPMPPRVYLRVGPNAPEHTTFIEHLGIQNDLQIFSKNNVSPLKFCHHGTTCVRFKDKFSKYKMPKMLAFDNFRAKDMCSPSQIVYYFHWDLSRHYADTIVFSVNDKGMKSCGEVDADDVLRHVFPNGKFEAHSWMLYRNITEIHHMLPDGTVRILACGGKKLEDPIVLTEMECLERETIRV